MRLFPLVAHAGVLHSCSTSEHTSSAPDSPIASPPPQIEYPEIEEGSKPRHRIMSSYEQRKEPWSKEWQYLLFAAEPYVSRGCRGRGRSSALSSGPLPPQGSRCHAGQSCSCAAAQVYCLPTCTAALAPALTQEVVAFKIPSYEVEKHPERLFTHWCAVLAAAGWGHGCATVNQRGCCVICWSPRLSHCFGLQL